MFTVPVAATEPPIHTQEITVSPYPTPDQTDIPTTRTTSNLVLWTAHSNCAIKETTNIRSSFIQNEGNCLQDSYSMVTIDKSRFFNNGKAYFYQGHAGRETSATYAEVLVSIIFFQHVESGSTWKLVTVLQMTEVEQ